MHQRNITPIAVSISLAFLVSLAHSRASNCSGTSVGKTPINDLGAGLYLGQYQGGLYPNALNTLPTSHGQVGVSRALAVQPLNTAGQPSPSGKYVLISIGMSNTTAEFQVFIPLANASSEVNHTTLKIVDGAQGGQDASAWEQPTFGTYNTVQQRLQQAGVTEAQVQAVWLKQADAGPTSSLPASNADAYIFIGKMGNILRAIKVRYPKIQAVFISNRIYAGYASSTLNPEPYAYEYGLAVKWLIEAQINQMAGGPVDPRAGDLNYNTVAPWIAWGPYMWADGLTPRSDGLIWQCSDLGNDGTHPSNTGANKVANMLLNFLLNSPFSRGWFSVHPLADIDNNGTVDAADVDDFVGALLGTNTDANQIRRSDLDGDGVVDGQDILPFAAAFLQP